MYLNNTAINLMQKERIPLFYTAIWIILAMIHVAVLVFGYQINIQPALTEAIFFNSLFALIGIGIWYMIKYSDLNNRPWSELLFIHLSALTVVLSIWIVPVTALLRMIFSNDPQYLTFLEGALAIRLITGAGLYLLIAALGYLTLNLRRLRDQYIRETGLKTLLKDAELSMLRFQINPHFLFNSLNAISSLIVTRPTEANSMVLRLSEFMRYSLDADGQAFSTLGKELEHCKKYLDIERVRFGDRLSVKISTDEIPPDYPVPVMVLQPLAENALKHGLYDLEEGMTVEISITMKSEELAISVTNPVDYSDTVKKHGTGTGLKNIRSRLALLYGRHDLMQVQKTGDTFCITIKIPMDGRSNEVFNHR